MRAEGLEPPCREALDPKSSASTNFATPAFGTANIEKNRIIKICIKNQQVAGISTCIELLTVSNLGRIRILIWLILSHVVNTT